MTRDGLFAFAFVAEGEVTAISWEIAEKVQCCSRAQFSDALEEPVKPADHRSAQP